MAEKEYSVAWQANNQFYTHFFNITLQLWESKRDTMLLTQDHDAVIYNMQKWYECVKELHNILNYYIEEEENNRITELKKEIEYITGTNDFYAVNMHDIIDVNNKGIITKYTKAHYIKQRLETITRDIWFLSAKYQLLPKRTSRKVYDDMEEQIEDENL